jgi:tetratricopeptide (TPR) repeat protein
VLKKFPGEDPTRQTVATTWRISIDKIEDQAARQLLNLLAFFAPDGIQTSWFAAAAPSLPPPLRQALADNLQYDEIIEEICRYSLARRKDDSLGLHRLSQEVIREELGEEREEWRQYALAVLHQQVDSDFSTAEKRARATALLPHIEAWASVSESMSAVGKSAAAGGTGSVFAFAGGVNYAAANYAAALRWYQKALAICEKVLGKEHPDTAITYNNIAAVYGRQGDASAALRWYEKALAINEKVLGKEHPHTAASYNNIAGVYDSQGDYAEALRWYEKAYRIMRRFSENHPNTKTLSNNMKSAYEKSGNPQPFDTWLEAAMRQEGKN